MNEVEKYYKQEGKWLTDMLYDKKFINPEMKRESLRTLEDFLGWFIQHKVNSAIRSHDLIIKIKED